MNSHRNMYFTRQGGAVNPYAKILLGQGTSGMAQCRLEFNVPPEQKLI